MCRVADHLPFPVRRYFAITNVPSNETRGGHAHKTCWQFLLCSVGELTIDTNHVCPESQESPSSWRLRAGQGIVLPPLNRVVMRDFTSDAVLNGLASEPYDPNEFIKGDA